MRQLITWTFGLCIACTAWATGPQSHWDGSGVIPVHRIPLYDENDEPIHPDNPFAWPVSSRYTCGKCHDMDKIVQGLHFNYMDPRITLGRPTEPWFLIDRATGTQLPLSYRNQPRTWHPEVLGISRWMFTKHFGRHFPGGGAGMPSGAMDPAARWDVAGTLEINCLLCHGAAADVSPAEWAKQIGRENFRWAMTAASGLAKVDGMASRAKPGWDPFDGPNPDDRIYAAPPSIHFKTSLFNHREQALVEVAKPSNARCLYCHASTKKDAPRMSLDGDVHLAAGLQCVSCHRNGLRHTMTRGVEKAEKNSFSCRGCHLRDGADAGRLGAPMAEHYGLPPIHFKTLSCTVCHSGAMVDPIRVCTSRANRLGIYGRARWATELPYIIEPLLLVAADGKVAPHRAVWPAFWARRDGDRLTPLHPDTVKEHAADLLDRPREVAAWLIALSGALTNGQVVVVNGPKAFRANIDGDLEPAGTVHKPLDLTWAILDDQGFRPLAPEFDPAFETKRSEGSYASDDVLMREMKRFEEGRARIKGLLETMNRQANKHMRAAIYLGPLCYSISESAYEQVPDEEVQSLRRKVDEIENEIAKEAKADKVDVDGFKVYRPGSNKKVKTSEPLSRKYKELYQQLVTARTETDKLLVFGTGVYRLCSASILTATPRKDGQTTFRLLLRDGETSEPLVYPADLVRIAKTVGSDHCLTEALTADVLTRLEQALGTPMAYVTGGRAFLLAHGKLISAVDPAAVPCTWPLAHDVRPAARALGANHDCKVCHTPNAGFFFASVTPPALLASAMIKAQPMHQAAGFSPHFHRMFGASFLVRELGKGAMAGLLGLLALFLLAGLLVLMREATEPAATPESLRARLDRLALWGALLCFALRGITGFLGSLVHGSLRGWPLLLHVVLGPMFVLALVMVLTLRGRQYGLHTLDVPWLSAAGFWTFIASAAVLLGTALAAMTPLLNTEGQHVALLIHRLAAWVSIATLLVWLLAGVKTKTTAASHEP